MRITFNSCLNRQARRESTTKTFVRGGVMGGDIPSKDRDRDRSREDRRHRDGESVQAVPCMTCELLAR